MSNWKIRVGQKSYDVEVEEKGYGDYAVKVGGKDHKVTVEQADWGVTIQVPGGVTYAGPAAGAGAAIGRPVPGAAGGGGGRVAPDVKGKAPEAAKPAAAPPAARPAAVVTMTGNTITSPMPGRVVRVIAEPGKEVKPGDPIVVLESMKMENTVVAPRAGKIAAVHVKKGDNPNTGAPIAEYA